VSSASHWARETFGDVAGELADIIPACLVRAHDRARTGQEGVHTQTLEAYGHGLYAVQYEELAAGISEQFAGVLTVGGVVSQPSDLRCRWYAP
jgi:hypothetical protein